jgi:hypothetical protein
MRPSATGRSLLQLAGTALPLKQAAFVLQERMGPEDQ